ncbi:MAG: rhodanese-like domain-containing protein [Burkholderiales bacterium]|nr:rhodanese-like domain-containing protein [Burkholderiales bacterium]
METIVDFLTPKKTVQFLLEHPQALFIDCRSEREFRFVGHPAGASHVSWNDGPAWEINPDFVDEVRKLAGDHRDRPLVLICRDGSRSVEAGRALEAAGFSGVRAVLHGFEGDVGADLQRGSVNGWRFDGLPWGMSGCGKCGP